MLREPEKNTYAPLPSTLESSGKHAQNIYETVLEHAEKTYAGDQPRAHRVAWSAVKREYEKSGDRWVPKK